MRPTNFFRPSTLGHAWVFGPSSAAIGCGGGERGPSALALPATPNHWVGNRSIQSLVGVLMAFLLACGGGKSGDPASGALTVPAPSALVYVANPAVYTKGSAIAVNTPSSSGGAVVTYMVSPALPAGLSLNASTGVIAGTPTAITALAPYKVTAANSGGSTTASVSITVNDLAPSGLTYTQPSVNYTTGNAIVPNSPTIGGGAVTLYTVSPALPTGLTLNATTGAITGTPTAITTLATYTVTATNTGGSTSAGLDLRVLPPAPAITVQPTNASAQVGRTANFSVNATGTGPLTYQWQKNDVNIAGATSNSFTTPTLVLGNRGETYRVLVMDGYGSQATSSEATLSLTGVGVFIATHSLATARHSHTATLLSNGKVLIVGGNGTLPHLASAELYDPATGAFSATGSLDTGREGHTATLLPNGKVLIAGGNGASGFVSVTELYDPVTGTFSVSALLSVANYAHTATLLPNGKVLIAGGFGASGSLAKAQLYDPATGTFSTTGSLISARDYHTATLLPNGKVLICGGVDSNILASAELYDPTTGIFTATGSLAIARYRHTAILMLNGQVAILGNADNPFDNDILSEHYNPGTGTFSNGVYPITFNFSSVTLLHSGKVLMAGGATYNGSATALGAYLYGPLTERDYTGNLVVPRFDHTATLLPNGKVLIVGGVQAPSLILASAELYDPQDPL